MSIAAEVFDVVTDLGAPDALRVLVESEGVGAVLCDLAQICDELAEQDASAGRYAHRNQWYKCARMIEEASGEEIIVLGWRKSGPWEHSPGFYKPLLEAVNS